MKKLKTSQNYHTTVLTSDCDEQCLFKTLTLLCQTFLYIQSKGCMWILSQLISANEHLQTFICLKVPSTLIILTKSFQR